MAGTDIIKYNSSPKYSSDEVLEKEIYGAKQVQNARKIVSAPIHLVKQDQQSSFDDEIIDDPLLNLNKAKKDSKTHPIAFKPKLSSSEIVFPPVTPAAPLSEEEKAEETDSSLDKAFHEGANITRESHYEHANYNMQEIMRRQKLIHDLHSEKEKLLDQLAERMKKSKNLGWIHSILSLGTAGLTTLGIIFTLATGGLGTPLLVALQAAATAVNGIIGASNKILDLQSQKEQGEIEVLRNEHELENRKIEDESHNRQVIISLLHKLVEIELQIAKNRNHTRMN